MSHTLDFDAVGIDALRAGGGIKWSLFPDKIGAFVAEMDFGTAPEITAALHAAIDAGALGYLPSALAADMSSATAAWHRDRYGWTVDPAHIHPIADVIKGLEVAIEHYSAPGSPVILPTPSYMPFLSVPPTMGREIIQVPLVEGEDGYTLDLDGIDRAFAAGGGLLILCNPYNPVGRVFTRDELTALSLVVERHGGRVFSDEIHAPLVYAGSAHVPYASVSAATAAHTVTATSASKAWNLPGLKTAQLIITDPEDAVVWERIGPMASHGASTLGVIANTVAYAEGGAWLDGVIDYLDGNRRFLGEALAAELPGIRYRAPQGTYIGWLDARGLGLDAAPAAFFRDHAGVALTEGSDCGPAGAGFLRFVFATPRPIIARAVEQMGAAYRERAQQQGSPQQ
ncbi:aminotransferase class I/II-fold pyridoxal phosphate-dependent enzyme [Microbacterium sp. 1P10UB]|uniref:MalY/PatB family protein n=1 Tax=unclassified Microbacterium TaxID=2609290 RepID=UPI0039A2F728